MNLKQLEAFLWVARLGSFSKTAERLFTTQPAISSRIANLEDELRTVLFDREGGAVRITAAGHGLLPLAEDALGAVQTMRERAGMPAEVSGLLRLGVSETIVQTWLSDLLAELRVTYPALDVEISVDVTANLRNELVEHALDLALLMGPGEENSEGGFQGLARRDARPGQVMREVSDLVDQYKEEEDAAEEEVQPS